MNSNKEKLTDRKWFRWTMLVATIVVVFLLGLLASAILERRAEAVFAYTPQVDHGQYEPRNEVWGENFPRQYQSYIKTADTTFSSKYNGAVMIDMLERHPEMVVLWAGYGFSKDYTQGRGHYHAIKDTRETLRTGAPIGDKKSPMPNTCWTCKSTDVPRMMQEIGVAEFYEGTWEEMGHQMINPIGCADCHDANTMKLRVTRPALIEAFERRGKDITQASHQEMRTLVCAQCHVEYYFNNEKVDGVQYLTFPWDNGFTADAMEEYYDNMDFSDWTHQLSRAPMLKAQHPGYETYITGIHAKRGVSCADCHMPYKSEGGIKYTDHHIQSPLNNVANSCQVCHREETASLIQDVYDRQDKVIENRNRLEELLVRAHVEAKTAWDHGATQEMMQDVLMDIRHAQWRWDYAAAAHGASFHSPVEISRVVGQGLVIAQEARVKLVRILSELGHNEPVPYPDIETKAKAQAYIGLDMEELRKEKHEFLETVVPKWEEQAEAREATYKVSDLSE